MLGNVLIWVHLIWQKNNLNIEICQFLQGLGRCGLPGLVPIIGQDHLFAEFGQMTDMLSCQGCSHRCHCIFKTSPIGSNDIHETLHQVDFTLLFDGGLGLIQMIELITLIKNRRSPAVFVLGHLFVCQVSFGPNSPRKCNYPTMLIRQGKHNSSLKGIINHIGIACVEETRVE